MSSYKPAILVLGILFPCLATLFLCFRLQAKRLRDGNKWRLTADDWCVLGALIISYAFCVDIILESQLGNLGGHTKVTPDGSLWPGSETTIFLKTDYISSVMIMPLMGLIKISILILYGRIFNGHRFIYTTRILVGIMALWTLAFTFANLFACYPIHNQWSITSDEGCVDFYALYMAGTVSNTATDVMTLCWPIWEVSKLHLPLRRKVAVLFMFLLGGLVTAVGAVRIYYLVKSEKATNDPLGTDLDYEYAPPQLWTIVEINVGIICACLPLLRPLYKGYRLDSAVRSVRSLLLQSRFLRSRSTTDSSLLPMASPDIPQNVSEHPKSREKESEEKRSLSRPNPGVYEYQTDDKDRQLEAFADHSDDRRAEKAVYSKRERGKAFVLAEQQG